MTEDQIKALFYAIKTLLKTLYPVPLGSPDSYWEDRKRIFNKAIEFIDIELLKFIAEREDGEN